MSSLCLRATASPRTCVPSDCVQISTSCENSASYRGQQLFSRWLHTPLWYVKYIIPRRGLSRGLAVSRRSHTAIAADSRWVCRSARSGRHVCPLLGLEQDASDNRQHRPALNRNACRRSEWRSSAARRRCLSWIASSRTAQWSHACWGGVMRSGVQQSQPSCSNRAALSSAVLSSRSLDRVSLSSLRCSAAEE